MTDVLSFEESQKEELSNIVIKIITIGIEKSGTRQNNSTWRGRNITIQDKTGLIKVLMAWNDDSKSFEEGKCYKLYDLSWKPYKDSMQAQLSTVTKIEPVDNFIIEKQTNNETSTNEEFLRQKQKEIEKQQDNYQQKIKELKEKYPEFVISKQIELDKLLILDSMVNESLTQGNTPPNPHKVGLYMKILNEVKDD